MYVKLTENEAQLTYDALDILRPDDPETSEFLEGFIGDFGDKVSSGGEVEIDLCDRKLALMADALDVVSPEDVHMQELAEDLCARVRQILDDGTELTM